MAKRVIFWLHESLLKPRLWSFGRILHNWQRHSCARGTFRREIFWWRGETSKAEWGCEYSSLCLYILSLISRILFLICYFKGSGACNTTKGCHQVEWSNWKPKWFCSLCCHRSQYRGLWWRHKVFKSIVSLIYIKTPTFNTRPFNEYYLVAYLANMTSAVGSKANQYFETYLINLLDTDLNYFISIILMGVAIAEFGS